MNADELSLRERLILAGMDEIEQSGVQNFSMRRVAKACGVSCAAPYKHFADKSDFVMAIIFYITEKWCEKQQQIERQYEGDTRRQLIEISVAYVHFLCENPQYRSILMLRDDSLEPGQAKLKSEVSRGTRALIDKYCAEVSMPKDVRLRKTFVVRSLIYGAALMLDNGELENKQESYDVIAAAIAREFDLA